MKKPTQMIGWKKYTPIIIPIILLLLTTVFIIASAYYNTQQSARSTGKINASARLSVLSQNIKNSVYNIDIYAKEIRLMSLGNMPDLDTSITSDLFQQLQSESAALYQATKTFDHMLNTFMYAEPVSGKAGEANITVLSDAQNRLVLEAISEIWQPYQRLIGNFSRELQEDKLNVEVINYATDYTRIFNDRLSALAEKITDNLSTAASEQSQRAQLYLTIGFIVALSIAVYLIFIAFRQLLKSDRALMRSQRELNDIMDTITEGLFLIDEDLRIGEQHSAELERILRTENIANKPFTELLHNRVSDKDIDLTKGFLEQLFNSRIYSELIESLNPLSRIKIFTRDEEEGNQEVYLSFSFHRVYEGKIIKNVLVSVRDITENVLLEKRLEQERIDNEAKLEMLSTIIQVDPNLMNEFIDNLNLGAQEINNILKSASTTRASFKGKLHKISRIVHSLKGEASALNLESFTNKCEKIEDSIATIKRKNAISGNDFLGLTLHLDELLTLNEKARHLFDRIASGKLSTKDLEDDARYDVINNRHATEQYLSRFAEKIAHRNGNKQVRLQFTGLDHPKLKDEQASALREASLQLLRNAIVHGIESPEKRRERGKKEAGLIDIRLELDDDGFWLYHFGDDGCGIDFERLRQLAAQDAHFAQQDSALLSHNELIRFMFRSGVSTAQQAGEDAGRGVGMDVIRDAIKQLYGKLQVYTEKGQYTRFIIKFPKHM